MAPKELQVLSDHEVAVSKRDLERTVLAAEGYFKLVEALARREPDLALHLLGIAEKFGAVIAAVGRVRNTLVHGTPE
jgi:hypothetical protein